MLVFSLQFVFSYELHREFDQLQFQKEFDASFLKCIYLGKIFNQHFAVKGKIENTVNASLCEMYYNTLPVL